MFTVSANLETKKTISYEEVLLLKNKRKVLFFSCSHSTASSVSSVRSSVSSMHDAGRPSVNTSHDVGRSSVSSMHEVGRATSGHSYHHQESSGTGFGQGGTVCVWGNIDDVPKRIILVPL